MVVPFDQVADPVAPNHFRGPSITDIRGEGDKLPQKRKKKR